MKPYYEEKGITIYNCDCRELLPQLGPVDLVLTDPPYGINIAAKPNVGGTERIKRGGFGNVRPSVFEISDWDKEAPSKETLTQVISASERAIIWGGNYFGLPGTSGWLVWDKDNAGTHFADCELAWTNLPGAVRKFKWRWNGMLQENMGRKDFRQHPTQKPVALMKWCIQQAGQPQTILDPFLGSGTTLRAAKDLGLSAIGIEIEEKYCEIAAERLRQEVFDFEVA